MEPDEGAESERAVGRADEAEVRREEEQTDEGAAAESRPAELPGEPSEAKGCRGGARAEAGGRGARATVPGLYFGIVPAAETVAELNSGRASVNSSTIAYARSRGACYRSICHNWGNKEHDRDTSLAFAARLG